MVGRVGVGVCMRRGDTGGARNTHTRVQLPLQHNNNRRSNAFCGEEEAKDGSLKREEEGGKQSGRRK